MESTVGNAIPAVGSRISLISSGYIRYEGILYSIDMLESKIALQQGECLPDIWGGFPALGIHNGTFGGAKDSGQNGFLLVV